MLYIDGLINNAGITSDALLVKAADGKVQVKMSLADFNRVIAVDLRGIFLCGREAAVHMIEGGRRGVIINISSISRAGNAGQTNYAAAKAGVAAMTVTWAKELARYHIRAPVLLRVSPNADGGHYPDQSERSFRPSHCGGLPVRRRLPRRYSSSYGTTITTAGFWKLTAGYGYDGRPAPLGRAITIETRARPGGSVWGGGVWRRRLRKGQMNPFPHIAVAVNTAGSLGEIGRPTSRWVFCLAFDADQSGSGEL
jgi:short chain dehydrogenase